MRLFDTHCHFESDDPAEIAEILRRAKAAGVEAVMAVGGSVALNRSASVAASLRGKDLPRVLLAQGLDRDQVGTVDAASCRVDGTRDVDAASCRVDGARDVDAASCRVHTNLAARGEIGLDYHYSPETREAQCELFAAELERARQADLPVVIHTREADDDTLGLLREIPSRGIIHCYTGTPEAARAFLDLGFYISISGIVTFRAADNVRASARVVPDDRLLIETDSPFLAPVPMRGQPNEPGFVRHTCAFLAAQRGMSADALAELTFANAVRLLEPNML